MANAFNFNLREKSAKFQYDENSGYINGLINRKKSASFKTI